MFKLPGIKNVNPIFQHLYLPHPSRPKTGPPFCTHKQRISKAFRYGPQARNEPFLSPFSLSAHTHTHTQTQIHTLAKGSPVISRDKGLLTRCVADGLINSEQEARTWSRVRNPDTTEARKERGDER